MKKLNEIQLEIQRLERENDINRDRLEYFEKLGDMDRAKMYTKMISNCSIKIDTLGWAIDYKYL